MENQSIEVSQNSQEQEELLTYKQAAKVLGIPIGTLYSWVHHRKIQHVRLCGGRVVRFSFSALHRLIQDSIVSPKIRSEQSSKIQSQVPQSKDVSQGGNHGKL